MATEAGRRSGRPLTGISLLIVDDDEDYRDMMCLLMKYLGATVDAALSGDEALQRAARHSPDAILCDLQMPGMDGFALIEQLRHDPRLHEIPVVAVTGLGSEGDKMRTRAAGFAAHLVKPINSEALSDVVVNVVRSHEAGAVPH
jgi:CheY-like chemotaxis protein